MKRRTQHAVTLIHIATVNDRVKTVEYELNLLKEMVEGLSAKLDTIHAYLAPKREQSNA